MRKKVHSVLSVLVCFGVISFSLPAQGANSASVANRRTAVRYLKLAKQFASEKLWGEADSNAKMGLAYDDGIADLWYLRALAQGNLGEKKSRLLPLVVTALTEAEWVDYNRNAARVLYADLLCDTRQFTQSLAALDSEPFIYSADAEYIRAKAYYALGDDESVAKARARLDSARRVYPADSRFAGLFYAHEYQIFRRSGVLAEPARSLANAFSLMIPRYRTASGELELFAAIFASDDEKKSRLLKAFDSKGLRSPLYALESLRAGLLDEDAALDYFYQFSDTAVSASVLEDFAKLLSSDDAKTEFAEYLNSYNGTLTFDTDGDLLTNMTVAYKRGRPERVSYDENQDGESEWGAVCDFGVPLTVTLAENALELQYSSWPYISAARYGMQSLGADLRFSLIDETLSWSPFTVEPDSSIKESLGFDFFTPVLARSVEGVSGQDLLRAALNYTIPSRERAGAVIEVSLLNGVAQLARYSVGGKIYATAQFENGIPVSRSLDVDGDGLFETTEFYGYSQSGNQRFISAGDELQMITNLFGSPVAGTGFYVKKITVDQNGDTVANFTEEYLPGDEDGEPGKISSWDTNADGSWDVQYVKHPVRQGELLREEARFHRPLTDSVVVVESEGGVPVRVLIQNQHTDSAGGSEKTDDSSGAGADVSLSVVQGGDSRFYWIVADKAASGQGDSPDSEKGGSADSQDDEGLNRSEAEKRIIEEIGGIGEQGVSRIVESGGRRFLSVRVEQLIFAMEQSNEKLPELVEESEEQ